MAAQEINRHENWWQWEYEEILQVLSYVDALNNGGATPAVDIKRDDDVVKDAINAFKEIREEYRCDKAFIIVTPLTRFYIKKILTSHVLTKEQALLLIQNLFKIDTDGILFEGLVGEGE